MNSYFTVNMRRVISTMFLPLLTRLLQQPVLPSLNIHVTRVYKYCRKKLLSESCLDLPYSGRRYNFSDRTSLASHVHKLAPNVAGGGRYIYITGARLCFSEEPEKARANFTVHLHLQKHVVVDLGVILQAAPCAVLQREMNSSLGDIHNAGIGIVLSKKARTQLGVAFSQYEPIVIGGNVVVVCFNLAQAAESLSLNEELNVVIQIQLLQFMVRRSDIEVFDVHVHELKVGAPRCKVDRATKGIKRPDQQEDKGTETADEST